MSKTSVAAAPGELAKTPWQKFLIRFKKNWQLHAMIILPCLYLIFMGYVPLYGLQIAWRDYTPKLGVWHSEFVGWKYFTKFFEYYRWPVLVRNTLALSFYELLVGFPIPIILALIIHVNKNKVLKKVSQNVSYIPHFISLVVMIGILNTVLNPVTGLLGHIYNWVNVKSKHDIRGSAEAFRHLYVWSGVWQGMGWGSIMYLSALSASPDELHEAAKLDGASRLRRVWSVDLPAILPTICLMLIMRVGSIMAVGYQKAFLLQTSMNSETSDIVSTFVYTKGIQANQMSFGTAIDLMNSILNMFMVFIANAVVNKLSDNELGLF